MNITLSDDFNREEKLRIVALAIATEITEEGKISSSASLIRHADKIVRYITTGKRL